MLIGRLSHEDKWGHGMSWVFLIAHCYILQNTINADYSSVNLGKDCIVKWSNSALEENVPRMVNN